MLWVYQYPSNWKQEEKDFLHFPRKKTLINISWKHDFYSFLGRMCLVLRKPQGNNDDSPSRIEFPLNMLKWNAFFLSIWLDNRTLQQKLIYWTHTLIAKKALSKRKENDLYIKTNFSVKRSCQRCSKPVTLFMFSLEKS